MSKRNATTPITKRIQAFVSRRQWPPYNWFTKSELRESLCVASTQLDEVDFEILRLQKRGRIWWDSIGLRWIVKPRKHLAPTAEPATIDAATRGTAD